MDTATARNILGRKLVLSLVLTDWGIQYPSRPSILLFRKFLKFHLLLVLVRFVISLLSPFNFNHSIYIIFAEVARQYLANYRSRILSNSAFASVHLQVLISAFPILSPVHIHI
jgi:hypothetical protein